MLKATGIPSVVIIGSGFSGLSAACFLAKAGFHVRVLEKHAIPGGRARKFEQEGFTFDMGPSWYWMPDVFERFFAHFGKKVNDYYRLSRLDPSYRVYWENDQLDVPADYNTFKNLFESIETGSAARLDAFIEEAGLKYRLGMQKLVYQPGRSVTELFDKEVLTGLLHADVFVSMRKHLDKFFHHPRLKQLMEFPVLFLGALAENIPALYSLMNYADIKLGTWYPEGGMYRIAESMYQLALSLGVEFQFNTEVSKAIIEQKQIKELHTNMGSIGADMVLGTADYHHIEMQLLPEKYRSYTSAYWNRRIMAPSCLIYFLGLDKKLQHITHHSLFFDTSFEQHAMEIYKQPSWPASPLFYVSCTSQTDQSTAPPGCENLFILIPVSTELSDDTPEIRDYYLQQVIQRMEKKFNQHIAKHIVYKRSYAGSDFVHDYHSFRGNAYGLANTLLQTANLKPSIRSRKVKNLYYAGQLTVPGPGVPPAIISGEVAAREIIRAYKKSV